MLGDVWRHDLSDVHTEHHDDHYAGAIDVDEYNHDNHDDGSGYDDDAVYYDQRAIDDDELAYWQHYDDEHGTDHVAEYLNFNEYLDNLDHDDAAAPAD